ncbi:MAG: P-loop NTPase fold protein [Balneola sp.]|jgi:hypothetical protein
MRLPKRDIENDKLNRENHIVLFQKLLENAIGPYVISIDAPWGTGKTHFVKIINSNLGEDYTTIFLNAWESDYTNEPLVTLISELKQVIPEDDFDTIADNFLKISKIILPTAIKIASSGLIDIENIAEGVSEIGEKFIERKLDKYHSEKESINNLKIKLREVALSSKNGKIIVFLDELDRCRPDYAIKFIENVKHFFDLEGYIFVLSVDETQLIEAIKSLYGVNFDAEKYLRRFVDYKFTLEANIKRGFVEDTVKRIGLYDFLKNHPRQGINNAEDFISICSYIFSSSNLTARDVNQIISQINILILSFNNDTGFEPIGLLISLVTLKYRNKKLYSSFLRKAVDPEKVIIELGLHQYLDKKGNICDYNPYLVSNLLYWANEGTIESKYYEMLKSDSEVEEGLNGKNLTYAKEVIYRINRNSYSSDPIKYISDLIEMNRT